MPRVSSRNDSTAFVARSTHPSIVSAGAPLVADLRDLGPQGVHRGEHAHRDRGLQSPPLGVDGSDDAVARGGQLPRVTVELAHALGELQLEPDVAQGQGGLLRDVGEQPVLEGPDVASGWEGQDDRAERT